MRISRKTAATASVVDLDDEGVVVALVAVSAIRDDVNDIIEVGALGRSIERRQIKVVSHHDWSMPIGRVESAEELLPLDRRLPRDVLDAGGGGLMVTARLNLATARGREDFADIKFFGTGASSGLGWSIGYVVPEGGATVDTTGVRRIHELDVFECSPVLFGAAPLAQSVAWKTAQPATVDRVAAVVLVGEAVARQKEALATAALLAG